VIKQTRFLLMGTEQWYHSAPLPTIHIALIVVRFVMYKMNLVHMSNWKQLKLQTSWLGTEADIKSFILAEIPIHLRHRGLNKA
jgi:hypothetical protein